ncbi:tau-tubulin kinase 1 [Anaeramoeba flamelloides]|uniref:non-specific serine/threonine protein kinase n=1 Tax=Anaeramoeba flamelloides TaxID=1746091 RepID=A0ABQ8X4N0_9EUKA|nr:tau-tubulin kinase 1 [Anaeramoeba flamelloides]
MLTGKVKEKWLLGKQLGKGGFGTIYQATHKKTKRKAAIKFENINNTKQALKFEVEVYEKLQFSRYISEYIMFGKNDLYNYIIIELQGECLSSLHRNHLQKRFSLALTSILAIEMIDSIQKLHEIGYLHRDIKPSNFLIRKGKTLKDLKEFEYKKNINSIICMIDFGLAKYFLDENLKPQKSRGKVGFRGTVRYASINSHNRDDLSRRDDLWSLFYSLVEFLKGELPWHRIKDKELVGKSKKKFTPTLFRGLPKQFEKFYDYLVSLKFCDKPNYEYLINLFIEVQNEHYFDINEEFYLYFLLENNSFEEDCLKQEEKLVNDNKPRLKNTKKLNFIHLQKKKSSLEKLKRKMSQKEQSAVFDGPLSWSVNDDADNHILKSYLSKSYKYTYSNTSKKFYNNIDPKLYNEIKNIQLRNIPSENKIKQIKSSMQLTGSDQSTRSGSISFDTVKDDDEFLESEKCLKLGPKIQGSNLNKEVQKENEREKEKDGENVKKRKRVKKLRKGKKNAVHYYKNNKKYMILKNKNDVDLFESQNLKNIEPKSQNLIKGKKNKENFQYEELNLQNLQKLEREKSLDLLSLDSTIHSSYKSDIDEKCCCCNIL